MKTLGSSAYLRGSMAAASEETPLLAKKPDGEAVQGLGLRAANVMPFCCAMLRLCS